MKTFISNAEISTGTGSVGEIWENIFSKKGTTNQPK